MDWRIYHAIYGLSLHHHWLGSLFNAIENASIPFMVVATVSLWLLARPGAERKWKLAATSALAAAALALVANAVIHALWDRPRPYEAHTIAHPWAGGLDASFPSDHASASIAIALTVLAFDALAGWLFLGAALVIVVGRLFVGAHYPLDLVASAVIGTAAALIVVRAGRPVVTRLVRLVERVTDPVLRPLWRRS